MNIDLIPNGAIKRVHVSQNDVGRTLTFNLFSDSLAYTVPTGATVKIQGTKPSGFGFSEACTVSGNVVTVDTTEEMTDEFGYIDTELQITNSGDVIGTSNFILAIERNPHPDNTTDGTQITAQSLEVRIEALEESALGGLTDEAKQALLNCLAHVAWIDEDGQDYYDALESALYPPTNLSSISCVYTQSGTVYDTDSLNDLKTDLVVTAHYSDSSTATVTTYTLSGTLTVGTSTITVSYGGKTTTFNVTVTSFINKYATNDLIHFWDGINNTLNGHDSSTTTWYDLIGTNNLVNTNTGTYTWDESGVNFANTKNQEFEGAETSDKCGGKTIEVVFTPSASQTSIVAVPFYDSSNATQAFGKITLFNDNTFNVKGESSNTYASGLSAMTDIRSISASFTDDTTINKAYSNGTSRSSSAYTHSLSNSTTNMVLGSGEKGINNYRFSGKVYAIRIYDRILTDAEVASNYAIDVARFGLGD